MKKKWLASVLALLLAVTPITAYAEDFSGGDGWKVSFDGKKMTSTFKNTDIDDKIYEMEPGDTVDFHIQLKNEYKQTTDWYMTNKVLKSLEDAQTVAEGGAYSYILTYIKQDGTKETLYSSEEVGGETKNASGEGLHQATNSLKFVKTAPGEEAYEEMWVAMLSSFSKHLKEKGWFDICAIAMDERPMEVMQKTLKVIRKADPDFKVSLAGNYHAEIEPDLYDYCIVIGQNFPEEVRLRRVAENKRTNYYTCCTEAHPNTFTFSDPAEAVWISYYSSKKHLDGYLRWAYNSWPLEPLLDSRFRSWAGGDTYLVYPGARSCIRFERLIEGIQAHEKINILRQEFEKKGNKAGLKKIEKMLAPFNLGSMPETPAAVTVNRANQILNSL